MQNDTTRLVLGNPVNFLTYSQVFTVVSGSLEQGPRLNIVTPYATFWRYAEIDEEFRNAWHAADLALPDGIALLWAQKMSEYRWSSRVVMRFFQVILYAAYNFGLILAGKLEKTGAFERVSGADLIPELLKYAEKKGKSVYVLGGWKDAIPEFISHMRNQYPQLHYEIDEQVAEVDVRSVGGKEVLDQAIERVRTFQPDLLIVALGPPFQEKWSHKHFNELNANVVINAGATIDFLSGRIKRAPKFLRKIGLEWLWRLISQPTRLRRILFAFPYFPFKVIAFLIKSPQSGINTV